MSHRSCYANAVNIWTSGLAGARFHARSESTRLVVSSSGAAREIVIWVTIDSVSIYRRQSVLKLFRGDQLGFAVIWIGAVAMATALAFTPAVPVASCVHVLRVGVGCGSVRHSFVERRNAAASRRVNVAMLFGFGGKKSKKPQKPSGPNPYRALGVPENATYDEIEEAVKRLSVKYADDKKKLMMLDVHRDKIFEDRLQQRMSGTLIPKVKESPYERKPQPKKRLVVPQWAQGVVKLPDLRYVRRTAIIMGIFVVLGFVTPTLAGSCMAMAFIAAAGFLYNRGLPEPVRDEYGAIGEVRPVKHRIVLKTLVINLAIAAVFFGLAQLYMLYFTLPLWCAPDSLVNASVVIGLWISCLFFQVQDPNNMY